MTRPLSVVVPTRDRPDRLARCLEALLASVRPEDDLVVVDSASHGPEAVGAARRHDIRVVRCDRPGASRARNAGVAVADPAHDLAFVDDDVTVADGWAAAMAAALATDGAGFVCGRVAVPPGQPGGLRQVAIKDDATPGVLDATTPAPLGSSANLGVRRACFDIVGGFDEALGGGARYQAAEDLDLFDRLLHAGCLGRYEPDALAWHEQWRTRAELLRLDWRYGIGIGARQAKLLRTDRRRAAKAFAEAWWGDGLRVIGVGLRERHEFLVLTTALRLAASVVGTAVALPARLRDGCFDPPARTPS